MSTARCQSRDIRSAACLQIAIGNFENFLKEGERALTTLKPFIKGNSVTIPSAAPVLTERDRHIPVNGKTTTTIAESKTIPQLPTGNVDRKQSSSSNFLPVATGVITPSNADGSCAVADTKNQTKHSKTENSQASSSSLPQPASALKVISSIGSNAAATAKRDLEKVVNVNPDSARRLVEIEADKLANQGTELARQKNPELLPQAINLLTAAIRLNPQCAGYYGNRSLIFYNMGEYSSSLNDANLALQFSPGSTKFLYRKAVALVALKRYKEATETTQEMLELEPGCQKAFEVVDKIRKATESSKVSSRYATASDTNDSNDVVIISKLPRTVTAQMVRDVVCSHCSVSITKPIQFVVESLPYLRCVVYLPDSNSAQRVATKLQNYPYGVHSLLVETIKRSKADSLPLSAEPPATQKGSDSSSDASSDNDEDTFERRHHRPQSSLLSPDSSNQYLPVNHSQANVTTSTSNNALGARAKSADPPKGASLFIGNLPDFTEVDDISDLIRQKVPSVGERFTLVKKPQWDYAFINLQSSEDAELVFSGMQKVRFGGVVLDVRFQNSDSSVSARPSSSSEAPPLSSSHTSLYVGNLPADMPLQNVLDALYILLSPKINSDFALYKQSQWRHCFLNFESPSAAATALKYVNGFQLDSSILTSKLSESRTIVQSVSHPGNGYVMSIAKPSRTLRIDNVDGAVTDAELRTIFYANVTNMFRDTTFSVVYMEFTDSSTAESAMQRFQGVLVRRSNFVIRYAFPKM